MSIILRRKPDGRYDLRLQLFDKKQGYIESTVVTAPSYSKACEWTNFLVDSIDGPYTPLRDLRPLVIINESVIER